jgi:transposase, IS5 family
LPQPRDGEVPFNLYSLNAPELECLAKGERPARRINWCEGFDHDATDGLTVGARSMPGNLYGVHTLAKASEQAAILREASLEVAIVDRGNKGITIDCVKI